MKDIEEFAREEAQSNNANAVQPKPDKHKPVKTWWAWVLAAIIVLVSMPFIFDGNGSTSADNKKPIETLSPAKLEEKQNSYVRTVAQEVIKNALKTPKSADFPYIDEWEFETGDVSFYKTAHSYVDYQNVFGTEVRSYFDITVRITDEGYQAVRIVFDGEMIYEDKITIASDIANEQANGEIESGEVK